MPITTSGQPPLTDTALHAAIVDVLIAEFPHLPDAAATAATVIRLTAAGITAKSPLRDIASQVREQFDMPGMALVRAAAEQLGYVPDATGQFTELASGPTGRTAPQPRRAGRRAAC